MTKKERMYWKQINEEYMTAESSDEENGHIKIMLNVIIIIIIIIMSYHKQNWPNSHDHSPSNIHSSIL